MGGEKRCDMSITPPQGAGFYTAQMTTLLTKVVYLQKSFDPSSRFETCVIPDI